MPDKATRKQQAEDAYWRQDLNPDYMEGQNPGIEEREDYRTAYDIKDLHNRLQGYNDADLQGIPVLPPGARLEQGATYIDLRAGKPEEFTARGDMEADPNNWYVPKNEMDYRLWNRLISIDNPERLGDAGETQAP
jgi:hypothetical protein